MQKICVPELDFIAPPSWARSNLIICVFGVCLAIGLLYWLHISQRAEQALRQQQQDLARRVQLRQPVVPASSAAEQKNMQAQFAALQKLHAQLHIDLSLFNYLEMCVSPDWSFLSIKPSFTEKKASLQAETRDVATLNQGLGCLEESGAFTRVELLAQQRVQEDPQRPLRVEILGLW